MSKQIIHSLILIITISFSFIVPRTNLSQYELQISAIFFIVLYLSRRFIVKNTLSKLIESVVFTFIVLITVNTTGGISSPFFFLIYFLLFSLAMLLEPLISATTSLTLVIFYFLLLPNNQEIKSFLPIISLFFITPFALYLSQEQQKIKKLTKKNEKITFQTFLFLSLILKNHLKIIKENIDNFVGDHELQTIKKSASKMEKLIEKFEKSI